MSLTRLATKYMTDKAWHGYTQRYETHLGALKNEPVTLVEIGVDSGASMDMWAAYFKSSEACFYGYEIDEAKTYTHKDKRVHIIHDNGCAPKTTAENVDIVIDDGSHVSTDIVSALKYWWPRLKSGGWYVVEDLQVQWRRDYGGSPHLGSKAVDGLVKFATELMRDEAPPISEFHVYGEIVFMRKS